MYSAIIEHRAATTNRIRKTNIGSKSFGKIPFTTNEMYTTIVKKMNVRQVQVEALASSYNCISNTIDHYGKDGRPGEV